MLHDFITTNREELVRRCRAKVATRSIPPPSEAEINYGVPLFLDQLVDALHHGGTSSADLDRCASQHGLDLLRQGFTVSQVIHDYGDVCQAITELGVATNASISTDDFRMLNRCLDEAIAAAVTMYERASQQRASAKQHDETASGNERLGFLVHELRNLVQTALVSFEVVKTGNVGVRGSTGAVLERSLIGLRDLVAHSLDEIRLAKTVAAREWIWVSAFIDEVAAEATLAAHTRNISLIVAPVEDELAVEADPRVLAAVVRNLLQNAIKFTEPRGQVTVRALASADRLLIEIEDECGGLPGQEESGAAELIPTFEQRGADRNGLGIGLPFSRWGAEANGGRLYARSLLGRGCIFTVNLPRAAALPPQVLSHTEVVPTPA